MSVPDELGLLGRKPHTGSAAGEARRLHPAARQNVGLIRHGEGQGAVGGSSVCVCVSVRLSHGTNGSLAGGNSLHVEHGAEDARPAAGTAWFSPSV